MVSLKHPLKLPTMWWFHFCLMFTPILEESIQFGEHIFQMGWFNHHLKTTAKMQQILDETPLIDEIPNVQPSYLTHCFFCCLCGHLAWKDPRVQRFYMVHHLVLFVGYDTRKKTYLIYYNVRAMYKRLKILKQPGRKVLISRKTSTLRILTPPMETPDPPSDTPGASKKAFLTPHDIPRILRAS